MKAAGAIIQRIQVTEKGAELSEKANQFFFRVDPGANKAAIKRAVESLFNVSVKNVNTMRYQGKSKRERTARYGRRADWKRAIVTLKDGDTIDLT